MTLIINGKTYEAGELISYVGSLEKENAELKCECRRCVYTDCPCILSDYGKDRNGICDHFKDVFDENAELKKRKEEIEIMTNFCKACKKMHTDNLTKAKEIIKDLLNVFPYDMPEEELDSGHKDMVKKAEEFLKEVEK